MVGVIKLIEFLFYLYGTVRLVFLVSAHAFDLFPSFARASCIIELLSAE
jgi:hypothetical protein